MVWSLGNARERQIIGVAALLAMGVLAGAAPAAQARGLAAGPIVHTVHAGRLGDTLAVDVRTGRAFVASSLDDLVVVVNTTTGALVDLVRVGATPMAMAVDADSGRVFVANQDDSSVSILDATTGALLKTVPVGQNPIAVAVDSHRNHTFVVCEGKTDDNGNPTGNGSVSILDATTGGLLHTTRIGQGPTAIAVDARSDRALITTQGPTDKNGSPTGNGKLAVLNAASGAYLGSVATGAYPLAIAVDSSRHRAFVTNTFDNSVTVLNSQEATVLGTVSVGDYPATVVVAPASGHVFVANRHGNSISILDSSTGEVLHTTPVGARPRYMAVDEQTGRVMVVSEGHRDASFNLTTNGSLGLLDITTGARVRVVPLGFDPRAVIVDAQTKHLFVTIAGKINKKGLHEAATVNMLDAM